jgi:hypothetical protein
MTDKLLEGIQYRELKTEFPDYKYTEEQRYGDWQDVPGNGKGMVFATSTQFRTKPDYTYRVDNYGHQSLDDALEAIRNKFENGSLKATVEKQEIGKVPVGTLLQERHVQYSSGANWYDVKEGFKGGIFHRTQFRVRPEVVYTLQFSDGRKTRTFNNKEEFTNVVRALVDKGDFHFSAIEKEKGDQYAW